MGWVAGWLGGMFIAFPKSYSGFSLSCLPTNQPTNHSPTYLLYVLTAWWREVGSGCLSCRKVQRVPLRHRPEA